MKRWVAVGGIVVVLLAAGWSLFWWLGRDALVRAFETEMARLEAAGWAFDWAEREVGGFPFGYRLRFTELSAVEPASGFAVLLPHVVVETEGADSVLLRLPERFDADVPLPARGGRDGAGAPPAAIETAGEAEGLVVRLAGAGGLGLSAEVEADALVLRLRQPGAEVEQVLRFDGLEAGMTPGGGETTFRLEADAYAVAAAVAEEVEPGSSMTATYQGLALTARTTLPSLAALAEMLYAGAPGELELALQAGPAEARIVGGAEAKRGTLDWQGGSISAVATLSPGRMDVQGETRQNVWTVDREIRERPITGALSAGMVQATYSMPMARAPEPDDMAIRLAALDMALDEAAWQAIDPQGVLPRGGAELVVDLSGLARVTRRIDEMSPGAPPPFEIAELQVREVAIDALDASLRASGSVEFLQPIGLPLGTVQVGMTGAAALIDALGQAGVLTLRMVETADAMLTVYARPATGRGDAWTTEITFTEEGPLVNGLPVR